MTQEEAVLPQAHGRRKSVGVKRVTGFCRPVKWRIEQRENDDQAEREWNAREQTLINEYHDTKRAIIRHEARTQQHYRPDGHQWPKIRTAPSHITWFAPNADPSSISHRISAENRNFIEEMDWVDELPTQRRLDWESDWYRGMYSSNEQDKIVPRPGTDESYDPMDLRRDYLEDDGDREWEAQEPTSIINYHMYNDMY